MKAATNPSSGTREPSRSRSATRSATAIAAIAAIAVCGGHLVVEEAVGNVHR